MSGLAGELSGRSREELQEILSRQEKILLNKRFVQTLPDKGKKITDFVEKVRQALEALEEEEEKQASLSTIGTEFQVRYQQALAQRRNAERETVKEEENLLETGRTNQPNTEGVMEASTPAGGAEDLVEALGRVNLSEEKNRPLRDTVINSPPRNVFSATQSQKKPHYIEVLDRADADKEKHRFKPNQQRNKGSGSSSPGHSSGSATPLSAEARRQRDRKHLDDITAAKLPPLHHSPAQLLTLEESAALLREQTRKQQEVQARLAAQKLAEGLTVTMSGYNPEGVALGTYREVHDDGAVSDED
ncbi:protein GRINL1A [Astyanax mexicanus]|uniref:Protein GRINL1A n=1 Tax=Astyanax mexicanus TaxID=7994 RepID=A0A8T2KPL7_ASTMX|nr:protein GRINL1A [Astyanax mexicanus]